MRATESPHWGPHLGPEHGDGLPQEQLTQMTFSPWKRSEDSDERALVPIQAV